MVPVIRTEATRTVIPMIEDKTHIPQPAHLILMTWLSPAFPVGGFAFSHGLEAAQEAGLVTTCKALEDWLHSVLHEGSGRNDAILLAASWRAAKARSTPELQNVIELGAALQPSSERYLEATVQGRSFMSAIALSWPHEDLAVLPEDYAAHITYSVAVGVAAAAHGVPLDLTLNAYLHAFLANLISAAVRLGIVGQTDGQRVIAKLLQSIAHIAQRAEKAILDDLGSSCARADMMSLHHETQYSRLFRS